MLLVVMVVICHNSIILEIIFAVWLQKLVITFNRYISCQKSMKNIVDPINTSGADLKSVNLISVE
jgi:hypothetical protein